VVGSHRPGERLPELTGQGDGGRGAAARVRAARRRWTGARLLKLAGQGCTGLGGALELDGRGRASLGVPTGSRRQEAWRLELRLGGCGRRVPPRVREELHHWSRVRSSARGAARERSARDGGAHPRTPAEDLARAPAELRSPHDEGAQPPPPPRLRSSRNGEGARDVGWRARGGGLGRHRTPDGSSRNGRRTDGSGATRWIGKEIKQRTVFLHNQWRGG
jgi:hypothetical protein